MSVPAVCVVAFVIAVFASSQPSHAAVFRVDENPPFSAAILVEVETGAVLFDYQADAPRSPASTQKLLLELVVMDAVGDSRASLSDSVYTSAWASRMGGSQVYLKEGEVFALGELMEAIAIASANDACVAVAEHIGGSTAGFVDLMNSKAKELGLGSTKCVNVHGLDDTPSQERNLTTARDLAAIARALLPFEIILEWSSIRFKPFRGGEFMLYTTNKLIGRFRDLDGLKTGYTQRAGYCLVATAQRRDMRLVSVVLGSPSEKLRDAESKRILSWGFNHFTKLAVVKPGERMGVVPLEWGVQPEVRAVTADSIVAVLTGEQIRGIEHEVELSPERPAPVSAGDELGTLVLTVNDSVLVELKLVAETDVARMSFWEMLMSYF